MTPVSDDLEKDAVDDRETASAVATDDAPGNRRYETQSEVDAVVLPHGLPQAQRLARITAAANPLLEAAMPLLRLTAELPHSLGPRGVLLLSRLLQNEVQNFQTLCTAAQIRHEHLVAASYCLCTAIDEAASSSTWGGTTDGEVGIWSNHQLAMRFHGDNRGGDKIFLLVGKLAAVPQPHIDLIEVIHAVLGLGFAGRYGTGLASEGRRQLETIRHRLFVLLSAARSEVPIRLSPAGPGISKGRFGALHIIPLRGVWGLLLLTLAGLFCGYKIQLGQRTVEVQAQLSDMARLRAPVAAAAVRPMRLQALLETEIASGRVSVLEDATRSAVSFRGDDMFAPGQAQLNPRTVALIAKVAHEINELPGLVEVIGHSDDQPIHTPRFPDNQSLSAARARAVAEALQAEGVESSRLQVRGLGAAQPLADNQTAAGRARNRRVDLVLTSG